MNDLHKRIISLYTTHLPDGRQLTQKEVALQLGVSHSLVWQVLNRHAVPGGKKGPRKISPAMKAEIIRQYTTRLPDGTWKGTTLIAQDLGVTDGAVQKVLSDAGIPMRDAKEAHAHGKRCGPFKHMAQFDDPPTCACGCGTPTHWVRSRYHWAKYARGHYRKNASYKSETWLRDQYLTRRRNVPEIAAKCNVNVSTVIRYMKRYGIERRTTKQSLKGVQAGAKNPAWKGGVTPERQRLYKQGGWREFVKQIYARDNYTCHRCKRGVSGDGPRAAAAHHVKSWAGHTELRFDWSNIVTLCRSCHHWVHSKANIARELLG